MQWCSEIHKVFFEKINKTEAYFMIKPEDS